MSGVEIVGTSRLVKRLTSQKHVTLLNLDHLKPVNLVGCGHGLSNGLHDVYALMLGRSRDMLP